MGAGAQDRKYGLLDRSSPDVSTNFLRLPQGCYPRLWVWRLKAALSSRTHAPGMLIQHAGGMSTSGDPVLDTVRGLEDDFADAMSHMYAVGNDLARLRARLAVEASPQEWAPVPDAGVPEQTDQFAQAVDEDTAPVPLAAAAPATAPVTTPTAAAPGLVTPPPPAHAPFDAAQAPPMTPPLAPLPPTSPWWQRKGIVAKILAVVGTGITLIGVAFLLALAIQMGFFGPLARVLSGALLAVALIGAAVLVRQRPSGTIGALGLAATGIATGYLDVLAVTRIYEWVPTPVGLLVAGLIGLGGLLLARAWDSQLLAVVTVLGVAVLAPVVGFERSLLTGGFLVLLAVVSWAAQVRRRWYVLEFARIAPTALYLSVLVVVTDQIGMAALLATLLAIFVLATSVAGTRLSALPTQIGVLVPIAAAPMLFAGLVVHDPWVGAGLLLALTCLLVLGAGLAEHPEGIELHLRLPEVCLASASVASLLAAGVAADGSEWTGSTVLLVSLLWAGAALVLHHRTTLIVALAISAITLLVPVGLLPYVFLRSEAKFVELPHLVTALATVLLVLVLARAVTTLLPDLAPLVPRVLVAVAVLSAGGVVILVGALLGQLAGDARAGFIGGQTGATLLWLATAAALLMRGLRGSTFWVPAGLALAAFSVGKLLLFDLNFLNGIARVLSFIVGGLLLLAMGAGYAQALERSRRDQAPVENSAGGPPAPPTV